MPALCPLLPVLVLFLLGCWRLQGQKGRVWWWCDAGRRARSLRGVLMTGPLTVAGRWVWVALAWILMVVVVLLLLSLLLPLLQRLLRFKQQSWVEHLLKQQQQVHDGGVASTLSSLESVCLCSLSTYFHESLHL